MLGFDAIGRMALGQLRTTQNSVATAVLSVAGSAGTSLKAVGLAAASVTMQGNSSMQASDAPAGHADMHGVGTFAPVGYAFYSDVELARPVFETRSAAPIVEGRCAVVPAEDRVYEVKQSSSSLRPPNRRRT